MEKKDFDRHRKMFGGKRPRLYLYVSTNGDPLASRPTSPDASLLDLLRPLSRLCISPVDGARGFSFAWRIVLFFDHFDGMVFVSFPICSVF